MVSIQLIFSKPAITAFCSARQLEFSTHRETKLASKTEVRIDEGYEKTKSTTTDLGLLYTRPLLLTRDVRAWSCIVRCPRRVPAKASALFARRIKVSGVI